MSGMSPQCRKAFDAREQELRAMLKMPKRIEQEDAFEREHCDKTDEELLNMLYERYLIEGHDMQRNTLIGIRYLEQRLGRWYGFMPLIRRRLRSEGYTLPSRRNKYARRQQDAES